MTTTLRRRRRWFTFSLRTLFVVVTLFAALLAWTISRVNWIQQRRAYLAEIKTPEYFAASSENRLTIDIHEMPPYRYQRAPCGLWLFGEQGIGNLNIPLPKSEFFQSRKNPSRYILPDSHPMAIRAATLFPESSLFFFTYHERESVPFEHWGEFSD